MSINLASSVPGGLSYSPKKPTNIKHTCSQRTKINCSRTDKHQTWHCMTVNTSDELLNVLYSPAANIKAQGLCATYDSVDPKCGGGGLPPEKSADRWCCYPTAALDCCHGRIPSTSDRAMSRSAFVSTASRAARLSLSLMLITYRPRKLLMSAPNVRKADVCHLRFQR